MRQVDVFRGEDQFQVSDIEVFIEQKEVDMRRKIARAVADGEAVCNQRRVWARSVGGCRREVVLCYKTRKCGIEKSTLAHR